MKYLITILAFIISGTAMSQIVLGSETGSNPNAADANYHSSVLLDFNSFRSDKGMILPYVRTLPQSSTDAQLAGGTLLLDATDASQAAVKFYNGDDWIDLSSNNRADITAEMNNQPLVSDVAEDAKAKMIIGDDSSTAGGVLVLESEDKAMILPMVSNTDQIINPSPGMMVLVYRNNPGSKRLAVFNGNKWTFWKPLTK